MKIELKSILKWVGATFVAIILIALSTAWYFLPLAPLLDDGPFKGKPIAEINDRTPNQSFELWDEYTLEVFDSTDDSISAAVQLRRADRSVQWTVLADGHTAGDTRSIRFHEECRGWFRSGTAIGVVDWTYGHEASYWFITANGSLRDYWYSW